MSVVKTPQPRFHHNSKVVEELLVTIAAGEAAQGTAALIEVLAASTHR
jgi:hypothetical protein